MFKFGFSNWSNLGHLNLGHLNLNTQRLNISIRICQCVSSTSTIIPLERLFQSRHCPICRFKISSQMFSKFIVQTFTNSFIRFKTIGLGNALPCFGPNRKFFENLSTSERFKMDLVLFSKIVLNNLVQGSHFKSRKCFFTQTFQVTLVEFVKVFYPADLGNFQ